MGLFLFSISIFRVNFYHKDISGVDLICCLIICVTKKENYIFLMIKSNIFALLYERGFCGKLAEQAGNTDL